MNKLLMVVSALWVVSGSAFGAVDLGKGRWSFTCGSQSTIPNYVQVTVNNGVLVDEHVDIYDIYADGKLLFTEDGMPVDSELANEKEVFGFEQKLFKVGKRTIKLHLHLQDYSDIQSWTISLRSQGDRNIADISSTYQSSDGDNKEHRSHTRLSCKVVASK